MTANGMLRTPFLMWRAWRLISRGLDRHLEKTLEIMEGYDQYLHERGMAPDEDARSRYYVDPGDELRSS